MKFQSIIDVKLSKNLRKTLLQGSPWIYDQALNDFEKPDSARLCRVFDQKKEFLCWGLYSPDSQLALRVLSLEKKTPNASLIESKLFQSLNLRESFDRKATNCFRLVNGEGDYLPGLICDIYNRVAVLQCDGKGPDEFWDKDWLAEWLLKNTECKTVYYKTRHDVKCIPQFWGKDLGGTAVEVLENGAKFFVNIVEGQKTGFFLDQRENRIYVRGISHNKKVLNLFSYSGGFSINAGLGGAREVCSVDMAQGALEDATRNWQLNDLDIAQHKTICADVFDFVHENKEKHDVVICDPPSLAKSEKQKLQAIEKYTDCFAAAAKKTSSGGHLILSSCSSHISFADFNAIASAALSKARRRGQVLRISGQGADHPFPLAGDHLQYLKFMDLVVY